MCVLRSVSLLFLQQMITKKKKRSLANILGIKAGMRKARQCAGKPYVGEFLRPKRLTDHTKQSLCFD